MKTKFFFIGILFAALTFTACGEKLDVNDPNPHCFKVSYTVQDVTGEKVTYVEHYWATNKELMDEIIPALVADQVIPVYEMVEAKDRKECVEWLNGRYICMMDDGAGVSLGYVTITFNEDKFSYEEVEYGSTDERNASGTYTIKGNQITFHVEKANPADAGAALSFEATINETRDVLTIGEFEFHLDLR
jgi:hypothetical protein